MPLSRSPILLTIVAVILIAILGLTVASFFRSNDEPQPSDVAQNGSARVETDKSMEEREEVLPLKQDVTWKQMDDPSLDGWHSEVRAEQVKKTLSKLLDILIAKEGSFDATAVEALCTDSFAGNELVPKELEDVVTSQNLKVQRWNSGSPANSVEGRGGLVTMLESASRLWTDADDKRFNVKVVRSLENEQHHETRQLVELNGLVDGKRVEQHAVWKASWQFDPKSEKLKLDSLHVVDFEQTSWDNAAPMFVDCARSILKDNESYQSQLLFGVNYWLERIQDMRYFAPLGSPGLAVADVNNDGLDDIYLCQEANLPNRLFLQQPDGSAVDMSSKWNCDYLQGSRGVLLIDFDNDGDQDLAVAVMGALVLASNEGERFQIRQILKTDDDTTSLSAADYDLDGDLDIYVCVDYPNDSAGFEDDAEGGIKIQGGAANRVYHDANDAGRNSLFQNNIKGGGGWEFKDVTVDTAISQNNERFSWAACWEDIDDDGDSDLYVANDFGRNNLHINEAGQFRDIAGEYDVEDRAASMSAAFGDYNRDGKMDLYVANMFSSAGNRITEQREFMEELEPESKNLWRRFAMGNSLFANDVDQGFQDVSQVSAVSMGRWSWSSKFADLNNDGWEDIVVANGYITSKEDTGDL